LLSVRPRTDVREPTQDFGGLAMRPRLFPRSTFRAQFLPLLALGNECPGLGEDVLCVLRDRNDAILSVPSDAAVHLNELELVDRLFVGFDLRDFHDVKC